MEFAPRERIITPLPPTKPPELLPDLEPLYALSAEQLVEIKDRLLALISKVEEDLLTAYLTDFAEDFARGALKIEQESDPKVAINRLTNLIVGLMWQLGNIEQMGLFEHFAQEAVEILRDYDPDVAEQVLQTAFSEALADEQPDYAI